MPLDINVTGNFTKENDTSKKTIEIAFEKIEKIAIDLFNAKQDANQMPVRKTYNRYGLIEGEWVPLSDNLYYDEEFKEYVLANFEIEPYTEDDGRTHIYKRKEKEDKILVFKSFDESNEGMSDGDKLYKDESDI